MSTQSATAVSLTSTDRSSGSARATIVRTALALAAGTEMGWFLLHPGPPRGDLSYATLAPVRDLTWATYLVDMIGFTIAAVALAIAVCMLVPARGAVWANVGAVLTAIGGFLFGVGPWSLAVLGYYATDTDAIPSDAGAALLAHVAGNLGHAIGPQVIGFMMFNVGSLLLSVALWRSRSVPRWIPIALAVLVVSQFGPWPGRVLDVWQASLMAVLVAIAWYARPAQDAR